MLSEVIIHLNGAENLGTLFVLTTIEIPLVTSHLKQISARIIRPTG